MAPLRPALVLRVRGALGGVPGRRVPRARPHREPALVAGAVVAPGKQKDDEGCPC